MTIEAGARRIRVCVGQRESHRIVVESGRLPRTGVVALLASLGESASHVVRILRALIIRQMAAHACVCGDVVVVVDVAIEANARRISMRVGERESYRGVIEGRGLPCDCRVALLASLSEASGHVVRVLRALIIRQVTAHAGRCRDVVIVVDVAIEADARRIRVGIRQRETHRRVIKCSRLPGDCCVALLASLRESSRDVVRVLGPLKILEMAGNAGRCC